MSTVFKRQMHRAEVTEATGQVPSTSEDTYTVPAGKSLRIDRFSGGFEHSTHECRVELLAGGSLVAVGYTGSFQFGIDLDVAESVDVVIRLVNGDPGALNMAGWWEGVVR